MLLALNVYDFIIYIYIYLTHTQRVHRIASSVIFLGSLQVSGLPTSYLLFYYPGRQSCSKKFAKYTKSHSTHLKKVKMLLLLSFKLEVTNIYIYIYIVVVSSTFLCKLFLFFYICKCMYACMRAHTHTQSNQPIGMMVSVYQWPRRPGFNPR